MNNTEIRVLTEEQILQEPEDNYMDDSQLAFFKQRLIDLYESTSHHIQAAREEMGHTADASDLSDVSDRATLEEQSGIALRIVEREQKLLPKIKLALERIRLGNYGYCLESGEPIGIPRLLIRPTAEYSADVKSLMEMKEIQYKD
ncbi:molecular chaperone DnaK [Photobacterium angustum]|uniref:Molecular chaperone DnaK n=1 Tax=Photobacterium angustum TaxID=661 RepID=A0A0D8MPK2_PHOAN|nr:TraR/DksA C4-type zinc finger protein [Photobacterium angustum]KJF81739.1 molecular chaperone DnaK [Photobacterium damselae subsp. damselae]KJF94768.1 molecular chaperone DnaK [Photobacterium angustum]KJG01724.1 molecular chaperone DnaK [Photobacterium angustum]KJG06720.1 molecular chaperone DnaK [Photobacterium angustum]KJG15976.1 molecular chaperone DnaK [Photobacterium angustum]